MAQYNYTVQYKPGRLNTTANALSRRPDFARIPTKHLNFADNVGQPLCVEKEFFKGSKFTYPWPKTRAPEHTIRNLMSAFPDVKPVPERITSESEKSALKQWLQQNTPQFSVDECFYAAWFGLSLKRSVQAV